MKSQAGSGSLMNATCNSQQGEQHVMLRSILAVIAGFMVMVMFVGFGTTIAAGFMIGPVQAGTVVQPPLAYLIVNLALSLVAAIIGGWVAGAIAGRDPMIHAGALSLLVLVLSVVSIIVARGTQEAAVQPKWYQLVVTILGVGGVLLGGVMRGGQQHA